MLSQVLKEIYSSIKSSGLCQAGSHVSRTGASLRYLHTVEIHKLLERRYHSAIRALWADSCIDLSLDHRCHGESLQRNNGKLEIIQKQRSR